MQDNKTALYWAVEKGHVIVAKVLLEYNANTEIPNKVRSCHSRGTVTATGSDSNKVGRCHSMGTVTTVVTPISC